MTVNSAHRAVVLIAANTLTLSWQIDAFGVACSAVRPTAVQCNRRASLRIRTCTCPSVTYSNAVVIAKTTMADIDGGQTNLAMDVSEHDDNVENEENARTVVDASKPPNHGGYDELSLRVDKLINETGNGVWIADNTAQNDNAVVDVNDQTPTVGFSRDRPFSASQRSRTTVASSRSRVSMSPSITTSEFTSKNLFSHKVR